MNDKISTMFEILKMIKSISYELSMEYIEKLIKNREKPNFILIKTEKRIPLEKREAYYIVKIKEH